MLRGDFTGITSPVQQWPANYPLAIGGIRKQYDRSSRFDPVSLFIAKKLPTTNDPCGLFTFGVPANTSTAQYIGKGDYQLNAAHSIMARVLFTGETQPVPYELAPDNILTTFDRGLSNLAQSYALGDTWLVSPRTVLSTRITANYTDIQRLGADFFNWGDAGVKNYFSFLPKYLILNVGTATSGFGLEAEPQAMRRTERSHPASTPMRV
jgi:hypothetical protein